jgi:TonB family protein
MEIGSREIFSRTCSVRVGFIVFLALIGFAYSAPNSPPQETKPHLDVSGVNAKPVYPASALANQEGGSVAFSVEVDDSGRVSSVRILMSSGYDDLDAAAIAAVLGWKFVPATEEGHPVKGSTIIALAFQPPAVPINGSASIVPTQVKPPVEFLPPTIAFDEKNGRQDELIRPIPCRNGKIQAILKPSVQHGLDVDFEYPLMWMKVNTKNSSAEVYLNGMEAASPHLEMLSATKLVDNKYEGSSSDSYGNSKIFPWGTPVSAWLSWDSSGRIIAGFKALANSMSSSYELRLDSPATEIAFGAFSATATFLDPELICFPDHAEGAP